MNFAILGLFHVSGILPETAKQRMSCR